MVNKCQEAVTWLKQELNNFGLAIPEKRVEEMIKQIIQIMKEEENVESN